MLIRSYQRLPRTSARVKTSRSFATLPDDAAYDKELRQIAMNSKREEHQTAAWCIWWRSGQLLKPQNILLRYHGGDAVGMSTVPEVIVANHAKMKVLAFSIITDLGVIGKIVEVSHEEVQIAANEAQPKMAEIMRTIIQRD